MLETINNKTISSVLNSVKDQFSDDVKTLTITTLASKVCNVITAIFYFQVGATCKIIKFISKDKLLPHAGEYCWSFSKQAAEKAGIMGFVFFITIGVSLQVAIKRSRPDRAAIENHLTGNPDAVSLEGDIELIRPDRPPIENHLTGNPDFGLFLT